MNKPTVNEEQYAQLVNEKMREHEMYKPGMGVKLHPEGFETPSGLSVIGEPDADARSIMSWAEDKIKKEYKLVVTRKY